MIIIGISISLLVIVAGMFLLAKSKKDQLGGIFKITSYITIVAGVLLLLGALCIGLCKIACCGSGGYGCGKASYHQSCGQQGCSSSYGCSKRSSCSKFRSGTGCAHGQQYGCKSSCKTKGKGCCSKSSSCSWNKGGKKVISKNIEKEGDDVEIEEEVIVEEE